MDSEECYVLRVRGLPWSATKEEILNFFSDCKVADGVNGIHMTFSREGRPSGEAYIEMETDEDIKQGLEKNNEHMGHRYIEVFKSKRSEMDWMVKRSSATQDTLSDGCVRLRGLPFGCSKEEIAQFFAGLEIVANGITLPTDYQGRTTGEAYVQFASREIAEKALGKHKEKIGHRYIEIFRSSLQELRNATGFLPPKMRPMIGGMRPSPYDRNDRFGPPGGRFGGSPPLMSRGGRSFRASWEEDGYGSPAFGNGYNGGYGFQGGRGGGPGRFTGHPNNFMGPGGFNFRPHEPGHCVHMRGLPFRASEQEIVEFFHPLNPVNIQLNFDDAGRPSGEADVMFRSHEEALKAMSKDKENMRSNSQGGSYGNPRSSNFYGSHSAGGYGGPNYTAF